MDVVKEPQRAFSENPRHWFGMQTHHDVEYKTPYQTWLQEALWTPHS